MLKTHFATIDFMQEGPFVAFCFLGHYKYGAYFAGHPQE